MPEDKSINQSRLGVDGAGGVKKTGQFLSRSNVRVYYVGGMAALGKYSTQLSQSRQITRQIRC